MTEDMRFKVNNIWSFFGYMAWNCETFLDANSNYMIDSRKWIQLINKGQKVFNTKYNYRYIKELQFNKNYGDTLKNMMRYYESLKIDLFNFKLFYTEVNYEKRHEIQSHINNYYQETQSKKDAYLIKLDLYSSINHKKIIERFKNESKVNNRDLDNFIYKMHNTKNSKKFNYDYNTVIIYFLGGGFLGGQSKVHQIITNDAAQKYPILAVYYRVSPENPYPCAINDAYRAIMYVISNEVRDILGYIPTRIILSGDSSGGNLSLALMNILIKEQLQHLVSGLWLLWPITNFYPLFINPGKFYALKSKLLNTSTLDYIYKCYIGADVYQTNYHEYSKHWSISPLFTPDNMLRHYPPTYIISGERDTTTYDSLIFARKLFQNDVNVKMDIVKEFENAFLFMRFVMKEINLMYHIDNGLKFLEDCIRVERENDDSISLPSPNKYSEYVNSYDYQLTDRIDIEL